MPALKFTSDKNKKGNHYIELLFTLYNGKNDIDNVDNKKYDMILLPTLNNTKNDIDEDNINDYCMKVKVANGGELLRCVFLSGFLAHISPSDYRVLHPSDFCAF